jgi:serine/threonine protein kinase
MELIKQRGPLPLGGLSLVIGEILDALATAHDKQIIHRDLKPENVLITRGGHAKILDFGVAKLMGESVTQTLTKTGLTVGTPYYMAPEQIQSSGVDGRTDIYSAGVMLFEGATGRRPFLATSLYELFHKVINMAPPWPRELRSDIPPPFEAIIRRAMEKDPTNRFRSAREMAKSLQMAVLDLPPAERFNLNLMDGYQAAQETEGEKAPPDDSRRQESLSATISTSPTVKSSTLQVVGGLTATVQSPKATDTEIPQPTDEPASTISSPSRDGPQVSSPTGDSAVDVKHRPKVAKDPPPKKTSAAVLGASFRQASALPPALEVAGLEPPISSMDQQTTTQSIEELVTLVSHEGEDRSQVADGASAIQSPGEESTKIVQPIEKLVEQEGPAEGDSGSGSKDRYPEASNVPMDPAVLRPAIPSRPLIFLGAVGAFVLAVAVLWSQLFPPKPPPEQSPVALAPSEAHEQATPDSLEAKPSPEASDSPEAEPSGSPKAASDSSGEPKSAVPVSPAPESKPESTAGQSSKQDHPPQRGKRARPPKTRPPSAPVGINLVALYQGKSKEATIFVDGKRSQETTPVRLTGLKPGLHRIKISCPGFRSITRTVSLRPGQIERLVFNLDTLGEK